MQKLTTVLRVCRIFLVYIRHQSIQLDPDEWYDRAGLFADAGEDQKALADYSEAIRLNPSFETAFVNRSSVFMAVGDISHAAADLGTALQLDPYDALAHLNLGSVSYLAGDRARAIRCWDAAARYGKADVILNARRMISEATAGEQGGDPDEK